MSDNSLRIWDFKDFAFEFVMNLPCRPQFGMFYSRTLAAFVTLEPFFGLNVWDVEEGRVRRKLALDDQLGEDRQRFEVTELSQLGLLLVMTAQRSILIYDLFAGQLVLRKALAVKKVISVFYSYAYQSLIVISHDKNIPVFRVERYGGMIEVGFVGRLTGHLSFVNCGTLIDEKGIFVSVDEKATVKFWLLTNLVCLRSVSIEGKSNVRLVLYLPEQRSLALVSKKINLYKLEEADKRELEPEDPVIFIAAHRFTATLLIFRATEVVFVDWRSGLANKVLRYSKAAEHDPGLADFSATCAKSVAGGNFFLLGDEHGRGLLFNLFLEPKKRLRNLGTQTLALKIDKSSNFYFAVGQDSLSIQKESAEKEMETLRKMTGISHISCVHPEFSFGAIFLGSGHQVYIVDYEFLKIPTVLAFEPGKDVLAVHTLSELGLVIVAFRDRSAYALKYDYVSTYHGLKADFLELDRLAEAGPVSLSTLASPHITEAKPLELNRLVFCGPQGEVTLVPLLEVVKRYSLKVPYFKKNSYNKNRNASTNFLSEVKASRRFFVGCDRLSPCPPTDINMLPSVSQEAYAPLFGEPFTFSAHSRPISLVKVVMQKNPLLCTASGSLLKVHSFSGEELAFFDLAQPAPFRWTVPFDLEYNFRKVTQNAFDLLGSLKSPEDPPANPEDENFLQIRCERPSKNNLLISQMRQRRSTQSIAIPKIDPIHTLNLRKLNQHLTTLQANQNDKEIPTENLPIKIPPIPRSKKLSIIDVERENLRKTLFEPANPRKLERDDRDKANGTRYSGNDKVNFNFNTGEGAFSIHKSRMKLLTLIQSLDQNRKKSLRF